MTVQGIDIASYQSSTFSTSGIDFVFIKATEGIGYINPKMTAQASHGRAAGLVVGFYHFLHPGNVESQAQYFVSKAASAAGDVLACDWEPTSQGTASNADKDAFIKAVKRLRPDHKVILYCDLSRWKNADHTGYAGDGLWIADPNHPAGHPNVSSAWLFHQYGIRGTDRDLGNVKDRAALKAWAKGGATPTPTPTPKPTGGTVTLSKADVQTLAATDGVFVAPSDAADYSADPKSGHHYWAFGTHVADVTERVRHIDAGVAALTAHLAALSSVVAALAKSGSLTAAEVQAAAEAGAKAALAELGTVLTKF